MSPARIPTFPPRHVRRVAALLSFVGLATACGPGPPGRDAAGSSPRGVSEASSTATVSGRYVPPEGRTLLIVGQDLGAVEGYTAGVHAPPGGITTYTSLFSLEGLRETADWGSGRVNGQACLDTHPESTLVIGLHMVETDGNELDGLVQGAYDEPIDDLGAFIRDAERPVYLRIGYEFDGPWNHYPPAEYIAAYRHLVDRLRSAGVTNFAAVWHSAANVTFEDRDFTEWWPGDEYVDWVGTSFFFLDENLERHAALIEWAARKGKPLMICEASPRGYSLDETPNGPSRFAYPDRGLTFSRDGVEFTPRTSEQIWDEWYAPLFTLVRENAEVVRALAYINVEWNAQRMWGSGESLYWGDSRVEANALTRERWLAEIGGDTWLHGGPDLFETLDTGHSTGSSRGGAGP